MTLEKPDLQPVYEMGWKAPERFKVKAADGVTDLYGEDWFSFIGFDAGWGDGVCCFHIAVAMIYSNDFCVSEFSHKKYLRFRID